MTMEEKENEITTYWVDVDGHKSYIRFNKGRQEAVLRDGRKVVISHDRLLDWLHTSELLGNSYGEL